jgi:hypothetical protein
MEKSELTETEKGETGVEQSQEYANRFLLTSREVTGETDISVYHCVFYGYCVETCEDFAPNFGYKRTGYCIMITHHLTLSFSSRNF